MTRRNVKSTAISLFSGAGGLDYGLEAAGFRVAVALDSDPDCCRTLRANRHSRPVIEGPLERTAAAQVLAGAGLRAGDVDLLAGGPPCQPFSKSGYWVTGRTLGLKDHRARTLSAFLKIVEEVLPRALLLENVRGLAFSGQDGLDFLYRGLEQVNRKRGARYRPQPTILNAADFGVPQKRERVFLVAARDGAIFRFPAATHAPPEAAAQLGLQPYRTSWDALADVRPAPDEDLEVRGRWADLLPSIPEGNNYLYHTARGGGLALFGWRTRYWTFLLKLAKASPSSTLQAQPGPSVGPFHWENRRLSARELCRLQTFPDDVAIAGSRVSVQRQVGNAVPSLLAEVLGRAIREQLLKGPPAKGAPRLLPADRGPAPPPEPVGPAPRKYRALAGTHPDHPGTGKGPGARKRLTARRRPPAAQRLG